MGLFSSKTKITVNVTVQPVFEEARIPNAVQTGVLKYLFDDITSVSDSINEEIVGSIGVKANNGFTWAKRVDYAAGIPTSHIKSDIQAQTAVLNTIASNVGQPITSVYYRFGPMNSLHYAWQYLVNTYGYNPQTNELVGLSATSGGKAYLGNMVATYTKESYDFIMETYDSGVLAQLGPSPQSGWTPSKPYTSMAPSGIGPYAGQPAYEVSAVAVDDYVTVSYEVALPDGSISIRGLTIPITGISTEDYHQCRYVKQDGTTGFFTYLGGSGAYPGVDALFVMQYNPLGSYFPWTYFRLQNVRVSETPVFAQIYKDAKKWCKYIGVDYDYMDDAVHKDADVEDVAQTILQIAVKPGDQNKDVIQYLFKYFSVLHENSLSQAQMAQNLPDKMLAFSSSPSQLIRIMDREFSQTLGYAGISRSRQAGSIGKKGTYTSHYGLAAQNMQLINSINPTGQETTTVWTQQPAYVYRSQVLDAVYEEIAVFGLRIQYDVHHKKGYGAGGQDPELLVPVDHSVLRTISAAKREQVLCRAMYMLVNTVIKTKTPWYASSIFKAVLIVVAIVVTVLSAGSAWSTIVAAASISTAAVFIVIFTMVLQYLIVSYAIKLFVKKFGPRVGLIAAVAAIAIGGYNSAADGASMWGENLVAIGNGLVDESNNAYQLALQDVADDMADFQQWANGQWDSLNDKRDELGLNQQWQGLTGFDFVGLTPQTVWGESPSDFYSRTVHSGNIGVSSYDLVENFHAYKLQLPSLNETQELMNGDYFSADELDRV